MATVKPPSPGPGFVWDEATQQWKKSDSNLGPPPPPPPSTIGPPPPPPPKPTPTWTGSAPPPGTAPTPLPPSGGTTPGAPVTGKIPGSNPGGGAWGTDPSVTLIDGATGKPPVVGGFDTGTGETPPGGTGAPSTDSTTIGGPTQYVPPPPVFASPVTPPAYIPPKATTPVYANTAGDTVLGSANIVGGTTVDPTKLATATLAGGTTIDGTNQDQIRQRELSFLDSLTASANGTGGPTAAENLYKKSADDAMNNQLALAATQHGYASGAANRQAGFNVAGLQSKAALDTAIIRAQEQQQARNTLGTALTSTRDADQKLSIAQSQLDQATKALNANLATNVDISNSEQMNQRSQLQAQLDQAKAFRDAAADESFRAHQADLNQQNNQFNTGQINSTNQFNATTDANRNNLDAQLREHYGVSLAQLEQQNNQFNAGQSQDNTHYYAGLTNQRDLAQLAAQLQALGMTNDQIRTFLSSYSGAASGVSATDTAQRQADEKFFWDTVNLGASAFAPGAGAAVKPITSGLVGNGGGYAGADSPGAGAIGGNTSYVA